MLSCKIACGGRPACKLGQRGTPVQIAGGTAACIPSGQPEEKPEHHKIMVVAKAPDMKDFGTMGAGRNIEKLKDLLALAHIDTRDVYVTGLVKCAPPKRPATVQEIKACMGHLADELRAVTPDVVILMGADSLRAFNLMGKGGINAMHGQIQQLIFPHDDELTQEWNVVVTTDPNALYMNPDPKLQGMMVKDLMAAKGAVNGHTAYDTEAPTKYKLIDSIEDVAWMVEKIKEKGIFAFDTESRSLPWSKEPLICMQFCWGYDTGEVTSAVLPIRNHDPEGKDWKLKARWSNDEKELVTRYLSEIFEDYKIPKIAHNIKYDMCVVRKHMNLTTNGFLFDTMLMHHILWEHPPHDLEYLADLELGTGDYSNELHKIVGRGRVLKNTYDAVPDKMMWEYGSKDAENTYRLMLTYFPRLKAEPCLWKLYQEEVHDLIRTLFKGEYHGVRLNSNVIDTLTKEFTLDKEQTLKLIKARTWPEFNPGSSADVAQAVKDAGYWNDIKDDRRAKGYTTNKTKLMKLAHKLPVVEDIMKFRNLTKLLGNYMKNAKLLADEGSGKARISYMIHGTVNGRAAAPFLHQIPRLDEQRIKDGKGNLRDMFVPGIGAKLVYGDYSQIELVTLAIQSGDEEMLNVFKAGVDIHQATAAAFLGVALDKVSNFNRSIGKNVNFGRVYGSQDGYSLLKLTYQDADEKEQPLTEAMIKKGFASLDEAFPAAARYFTDTVNEISSNNGVYTTRFGRMKRMGGSMTSGNEWARAEAERQAVNGSIQSPANSVTVRTLNAVDTHLTDLVNSGKMTEEEIYLVLTVHDSGCWEVMDEHIEWFVPKLKEIAGRKIPELDDFQFTMKVGVGDSWSEAEINAG